MQFLNLRFLITQKDIDYAEKLDWQVAIKLIGLTEGLGVRVLGEQLKNENEVWEYIQQVIDRRIGDVPGSLSKKK